MKLLGNKAKKRPMAIRVSPMQAAERKLTRILKENQQYNRGKKKR